MEFSARKKKNVHDLIVISNLSFKQMKMKLFQKRCKKTEKNTDTQDKATVDRILFNLKIKYVNC